MCVSLRKVRVNMKVRIMLNIETKVIVDMGQWMIAIAALLEAHFTLSVQAGLPKRTESKLFSTRIRKKK